MKRTKKKKDGIEQVIPEPVEEKTSELMSFSIIVQYKKMPKKKGVEPFWSKPLVMAKIQDEYWNGARDVGAAAESGVPYQTFRNQMQQKVPVLVYGQEAEITLRELFDHWREKYLRRVEKHIMKTLEYNPLTSGTQDAWRILERMNSKEWGLKAGHGSVDGNAPADLSSVVAFRAKEVLKKRNLTLK